MIENILELNFTVSRYAFSSFGTGIIAFFMFLVSLIFYFLIEKDEVLPYTMSIEITMCLYMFSYGFGTSSLQVANVVFWFRLMYINITLLMIVSLYTVSYLADKPMKLVKLLVSSFGIVIIFMFTFTNTLVTNEVEYIFHLTPTKGHLFWVYMIFSLSGIIIIVSTIIAEIFKRKETLKEIWPVYIGILFFLLHMYYSGLTSVYLKLFRARLSINILFYAFMIIIFFYTRIRNNIRNREQLFNRYIYDNLTKVYSRNYFYELLKKDLQSNRNTIIIGMIDMNKFKYINDTFGHLVGDEVLIKVGSLLMDMDQHIKVGRIGGDEFLVYTTKSSEEKLTSEINEVMKLLNDYITQRGLNKNNTKLGMSFGYTIHNNQMDYNELISSCDEAMYLAKAGCNYTITKFDEIVTEGGS